MGKRDGMRYRVALLGVSERSHKLLGRCFDEGEGVEFAIAPVGEADFAIVDIDGAEGVRQWKAFRGAHPGSKVVLLSAKPTPPCSNAVVLRKPVTVDEVLDALLEARGGPPSVDPLPTGVHIARARRAQPTGGRGDAHPSPAAPQGSNDDRVETIAVATTRKPSMRAQSDDEMATVCGDHEDVDPKSAVSLALRTYHPMGSMQQLLTTAIGAVRADGHARCLDGPLFRGRPVVLACDQAVRVHVALPTATLRQLCILPTAEAGTVLREARAEDRRDGARSMPANDFLWNIAIMTARGRIPAGSDPTAPVRVSHWPDFERLVKIPHMARIAEAWIERPASAIEIAAQLGIPQRYVFGFFSAAVATGLVTPTPALRPADRGLRQRKGGPLAQMLAGLQGQRDSMSDRTAAAASLARSTIARALEATNPIALAGPVEAGSGPAPRGRLFGRLLGRRGS